MSDTPVIYENPEHPLPEWACWMVKFPAGFCSVFEIRPHIAWPPAVVATGQTWRASGRFGNFDSYTILGPWRDSLRRIIRLTDPAYYVPENPYTDDEGFLPHSDGEMPEWLAGGLVQAIFRDGGRTAIGTPDKAEAHIWSGTTQSIIAYRIVGKQEKPPLSDRIRDKGIADPTGNVERLERHLADASASENGDNSHVGKVHPEDRLREQETAQWINESGVIPEEAWRGPYVKPRYPSDATYPREAVQRAYEHGLRDGRASQSEEPSAHSDADFFPLSPEDAFATEETRHRNEIAALTLTPVPGMDKWMRDVLREARRHVYAKSVLAEMIATEMTDKAVESATITADAMIEREDSE